MPFFDIHISQGSVATCLRRDGVFKQNFVANELLSPAVKKKFENRLIFGEVIGNSLVSCFFDSQCIAENTAVQCGLGPAGRVSSTPGFMVPRDCSYLQLHS